MYIGVDLGGTGIKVGIVDEGGKILYKTSCPTRHQEGFEAIVKDMAMLINKVLKNTNTDIKAVKSIGVGTPGSVDDKNGIIMYANNLNLYNANLREELGKYFDKPIYVGNDANCATLGEFFALEDENITDLVAITLGTGVGGGIIINKKIYTGVNGIAGELGHTVVCINGEDCTCGRKGCWEAYASATALIRDTKRAAEENPDSYVAKLVNDNDGRANGKISFDAARKGDEVGQRLVDNYVSYVGEGIVNIINTFRPHAVVIGGGISKEGDNLLNPVKEYVNKYVYGGQKTNITKISIAKLGNDAGIVGAAFLGK